MAAEMSGVIVGDDGMEQAMADRYAGLEIRILEKRERGYPVEITLSGEQEFPRGSLRPDILPWVWPSTSQPLLIRQRNVRLSSLISPRGSCSLRI
jgi:hypothetical protein